MRRAALQGAAAGTAAVATVLAIVAAALWLLAAHYASKAGWS